MPQKGGGCHFSGIGLNKKKPIVNTMGFLYMVPQPNGNLGLEKLYATSLLLGKAVLPEAAIGVASFWAMSSACIQNDGAPFLNMESVYGKIKN